MAIKHRSFQVEVTAGGTFPSLYVVPAGKIALVKTVALSTNQAGQARVGTTINGQGWLHDTLVDNNRSVTHDAHTMLRPGDHVQGSANAAACYVNMTVAEGDVADFPTLARYDILNTQTGHTVPAGKRLRLRNVCICPHAGDVAVNFFVGDKGYIYRRVTSGGSPVVLNTDLSINAGEQFALGTNGGVVNVFATGYLEDA